MEVIHALGPVDSPVARYLPSITFSGVGHGRGRFAGGAGLPHQGVVGQDDGVRTTLPPLLPPLRLLCLALG